jgi:hypothetical protein
LHLDHFVEQRAVGALDLCCLGIDPGDDVISDEPNPLDIAASSAMI